MNAKTVSPSGLEIVRSIDWTLGYFTSEQNAAICAFQNPFRVARLRRELAAVNAACEVAEYDWRECSRQLWHSGSKAAGSASYASVFAGAGQVLELVLSAELATEQRKPNICRAFGQQSRGPDDSWRVWAVLTREGAELFPTDEAAAQLWAAWGFDASPTPESSYSPTGRMFRRSLCTYTHAGHRVLRQSGARDV